MIKRKKLKQPTPKLKSANANVSVRLIFNVNRKSIAVNAIQQSPPSLRKQNSANKIFKTR